MALVSQSMGMPEVGNCSEGRFIWQTESLGKVLRDSGSVSVHGETQPPSAELPEVMAKRWHGSGWRRRGSLSAGCPSQMSLGWATQGCKSSPTPLSAAEQPWIYGRAIRARSQATALG